MIYPWHRTKILITSKKKNLLGVLYVRWLKCNMERRVEKKVQMTWENNKFSIKYFTVRICFGEPVFSSCQVVGAWGIDVECLLQSYRAKDARLIFFVMLLAETLITLKQLSVYECIYMCSCACVFSCIFIADCFLFLSHFLSTTMPPDLPHQRIIFKLRSSVSWRRPLMCPWAFSTQPKSHRRTHTDNSTTLHGMAFGRSL